MFKLNKLHSTFGKNITFTIEREYTIKSIKIYLKYINNLELQKSIVNNLISCHAYNFKYSSFKVKNSRCLEASMMQVVKSSYLIPYHSVFNVICYQDYFCVPPQFPGCSAQLHVAQRQMCAA